MTKCAVYKDSGKLVLQTQEELLCFGQDVYHYMMDTYGTEVPEEIINLYAENIKQHMKIQQLLKSLVV